MASVNTENAVPFIKRSKKYVSIDQYPLCSRIYSDPDELKRTVDAFMVAYDKAEAELRRKSKTQDVDEDGFIMVKPALNASIAPPATKKRKSQEGVSDFYRFQLKEKKIAEWTQEKRQETLDKIKLGEMKSSGKFQL